MFDSPKATAGLAQAGLHSPGYEGSQQSIGHMDKMFEDLVNDHDVTQGLDGGHEVKDEHATGTSGAMPTTETHGEITSQPQQDVEMMDNMAIDPNLQPLAQGMENDMVDHEVTNAEPSETVA